MNLLTPGKNPAGAHVIVPSHFRFLWRRMYITVVVSAWRVTDSQAAATEVPLPAVSQHVSYNYTATASKLSSMSYLLHLLQ